MRKHFSITITVLAILLIGLTWVGCSDDTIEIVTSGTYVEPAASGVTAYFPLTEGYSTIFEVENSYGTQTITYTVGEEISFADVTAIEWISYSASQGYDTGYFRATPSTLYYYEHLGANPEKIIVLPLLLGSTWNRIESIVDDPVEELDDETQFVFDKDGDIPDTSDIGLDNTGGTAAKNYPTVSEISMQVEAVEMVVLGDGSAFSKSVKVTSQNLQGTWNQYWFAPGVGLIKYIVGGSTSTSTSGFEQGELLSYGYKR